VPVKCGTDSVITQPSDGGLGLVGPHEFHVPLYGLSLSVRGPKHVGGVDTDRDFLGGSAGIREYPSTGSSIRRKKSIIWFSLLSLMDFMSICLNATSVSVHA
jgi:hypothetical protein